MREGDIDKRVSLPEKPVIIQPMTPPDVSESLNMYNQLSTIN